MRFRAHLAEPGVAAGTDGWAARATLDDGRVFGWFEGFSHTRAIHELVEDMKKRGFDDEGMNGVRGTMHNNGLFDVRKTGFCHWDFDVKEGP